MRLNSLRRRLVSDDSTTDNPLLAAQEISNPLRLMSLSILPRIDVPITIAAAIKGFSQRRDR